MSFERPQCYGADTIALLKTTMGHDSAKTEDEVMALVLCTPSEDGVFYIGVGRGGQGRGDHKCNKLKGKMI